MLWGLSLNFSQIFKLLSKKTGFSPIRGSLQSQKYYTYLASHWQKNQKKELTKLLYWHRQPLNFTFKTLTINLDYKPIFLEKSRMIETAEDRPLKPTPVYWSKLPTFALRFFPKILYHKTRNKVEILTFVRPRKSSHCIGEFRRCGSTIRVNQRLHSQQRGKYLATSLALKIQKKVSCCQHNHSVHHIDNHRQSSEEFGRLDNLTKSRHYRSFFYSLSNDDGDPKDNA